MWIRPWGFKEGCLIGAGLLVTGWLLQITIGEIDWSLFAYPVNSIDSGFIYSRNSYHALPGANVSISSVG